MTETQGFAVFGRHAGNSAASIRELAAHDRDSTGDLAARSKFEVAIDDHDLALDTATDDEWASKPHDIAIQRCTFDQSELARQANRGRPVEEGNDALGNRVRQLRERRFLRRTRAYAIRAEKECRQNADLFRFSFHRSIPSRRMRR
jgi:hypothetical protein